MNQRTIHNLTWLPIFIVGIASVGLGGLWCLHPEPWLLDQLPNEILLRTKFSELFSANINVHLPCLSSGNTKPIDIIGSLFDIIFMYC